MLAKSKHNKYLSKLYIMLSQRPQNQGITNCIYKIELIYSALPVVEMFLPDLLFHQHGKIWKLPQMLRKLFEIYVKISQVDLRARFCNL